MSSAPAPGPEHAISPAPTAEEAAAIAGALETFLRDTAPAPQAALQSEDPWLRAALLEGVEREPSVVVQHPWINT